MTKPKNPLFGFTARGTLGKILSFRRRGSQTIAEKKPIPDDVKSLAQLSWRHMYQKAVALWHALSAEEKQEWESNARSRHMTGFAWFMSQCLRPNPGTYLPLQGGVMQGDIDMDSHNIFSLPAPTLDHHAATKKYVDDAPPADHGADKHTNLPRFLFLPACQAYFIGGSCSGDISPWSSGKGLTNAAQPDFCLSTKVPLDFLALLSVKALWISTAASGNMYWRFYTNYAAPGEHMGTHSDNPALGTTPTAGSWLINAQESANPLTLPNITANDYLALRFKRQGDHGNDTLDADVYVLGLLFTYTANQ